MNHLFFDTGPSENAADTDKVPMGMLDRYKKTGGFIQLLTLLETCGAPKQAKFLEIIKQEDPRWAAALTAKMIDLNRVLTWTDAAVAEVTGSMLEINIAVIIASSTPAVQQRLLGTLAHIKRRKIEEMISGMKPSAGELATSFTKFSETIRKLSTDGVLRLDKIDPVLYVDGDIEDRLAQGKEIVGVPSYTEVQNAAAAAASADGKGVSAVDLESPHLRVVTSLDNQAWSEAAEARDLKTANTELAVLRKRVIDLQKEVAVIRQELSVARNKLEQIKKIA